MSDINNQVMTQLATVIEPELHRDIVTLNMVRDLSINGDTATFTIVLTTPACPLKDVFIDRCNAAVLGKVQGINRLNIKWDAKVPTDRRLGRQNASGIRTIIAVGSGKGGVGKSTISVNLAVALAEAGASVGLIDADILNPNVPQMMGLITGRPKVVNEKMQPIEAYGVKIMSTGFLSSPDKPMILRGPMLSSAIRQFFVDVDWGDNLDYMICIFLMIRHVANTQGDESTAWTGLLIAAFLNSMFWFLIGRYNPPRSSDSIQVIGMDD